MLFTITKIDEGSRLLTLDDQGEVGDVAPYFDRGLSVPGIRFADRRWDIQFKSDASAVSQAVTTGAKNFTYWI